MIRPLKGAVSVALLVLTMGALAGCGVSVSLPGPFANGGSSPSSATYAGEWFDGEILVGYESEAELARIVSDLGGQITNAVERIRVANVGLPSGMSVADTVQRLNRRNPDGLRYAQPNYIRDYVKPERSELDSSEAIAQNASAQQRSGRFDDPLTSSQYALDAMNARPAWTQATGQGITIGISDTGFDGTHPEIQGKTVPGKHCGSGEEIPADADATQQEFAHGTHVAGIAAARGDNGAGIVGVAPDAQLMDLKVFDAERASETNGSGWVGDANVAECLIWAGLIGPDGAKNSGDEADVINASWGAPIPGFYDNAIKEAIDVLRANGVVFVNSMGNSSQDWITYPTGHPGVLAVGATNAQGKIGDFSTRGFMISVSAPGVRVLSSVPTWIKQPNGESTGYMYFNGTSMAAPQVAGAVALLKEKFPEATPYQLQAILEQTADDLGRAGFDHASGHGRVDLAEALSATQLPSDGARVNVKVTTANPRDTNGDGNLTDADQAPGVPFTDVLLRKDGQLEYLAQTNARGNAAFVGIEPGVYDVEVAGGDAGLYNYRSANRLRTQTRVRATSGETSNADVQFNTDLTVHIRWEADTDVDLLVREPRLGKTDDAERAAQWVSPKGGAQWGTFSEDATGTKSGTKRERYDLNEIHYPYAPYVLGLSAQNASGPVEVDVVVEQNGYAQNYGPFTLQPGEVLPSTEWSDWWENNPKPDQGFPEPGPGAPWVY
ncbi:MAG: S8 family serine peptidase [Candidatus Bipolaricaulia bacterium]